MRIIWRVLRGLPEKLHAYYFRSDTITVPTPEMLAAMMSASVGDSVYGEDPTTAKLEKKVAEICGKEAGLLVPSGTAGRRSCIEFNHT